MIKRATAPGPARARVQPGGSPAENGSRGDAGGTSGGSASIGTIASVNGNTIYLTDTTGDTLKVTVSSSTKLTNSLSVAKTSLHPGDAIVVQGVKNSNGTVVATSVSDSGAGATHVGSSTTSSATSGSSITG